LKPNTGLGAPTLRSLQLVERLYPGNWVARIGLAAIHAASGDRERARRLVAEAVEIGGEAARTDASRTGW